MGLLRNMSRRWAGQISSRLLAAFRVAIVSIVVVACGPLSLVPPTPTTAPDLQISQQSSVATTATAKLSRPANEPSRIPTQLIPAFDAVGSPEPTTEPGQALVDESPPVPAPIPADQSVTSPSGAEISDAASQPAAPLANQSYPAPANNSVPTSTEIVSVPTAEPPTSVPRTSGPTFPGPKGAALTATSTATRTATPTPRLPLTPVPEANYPAVVNTPPPTPPGGYPAANR